MKPIILVLLALVTSTTPSLAQTIIRQADPQPQQVTLSNNVTKTNKTITGTVTTATTGTNVIAVTSAVSASNTFYLSYLNLGAIIVGVTTTSATDLGYARFESPTGTTLFQTHLTSYQGYAQPASFLFPEPIPLPAGQSYRVVVDPAVVNKIEWTTNFGGFER